MKKLFLFLICWSYSIVFFAQNGVTVYPITVIGNAQKTALEIDNFNNKWIGSYKGLLKFDGSTFVLFDTLNSAIPSSKVNAIAFDTINNGWIGTNKGIAKFDGINWTVYNKFNSGLISDTILSIVCQGNIIWIGTAKGLSKFDGTNWVSYTPANSDLHNEKVYALETDLNGDLWIGTGDGINILSGTIWTTYTSSNSNLQGISVTDIYIDDHQKWIINGGTIYKFSNNQFECIISEYINGLFDQNGTSINFANAISIARGPQNGIITNALQEYSDSGVLKYDAPAGGGRVLAYEIATNKIWFAHINQLNCFDLAGYSGNPVLSPPKNKNVLDINNIKAGISNIGDLHFNGYNGAYSAPKYSGIHSIFASGLWIGGIDGTGQLHQAAMTYRQKGVDYQPGPLDTINGTSDSITLQHFDKIWKVDRLKIEEFQTMFANGSIQNGIYTVDPEILSWPAHGSGNYSRNLAPFVDVNADGIYNPLTDGDYPKIKGDQMCFWIFNDNLIHTETGGDPLGVEVHASAYAYYCPDISNSDSSTAINNTTFYNFKIINRSHKNYSNTSIGMFEDVDLGSFFDDLIGCNKTENYGFVYDNDGIDNPGGTGQLLYGTNPPILSTVILNGPAAIAGDQIDNDNDGIIDELNEKNLMTRFQYFDNSNTVMGNPDSAYNYYNYLNGKWLDNTLVTYGGNGYSSGGPPTTFMFDGIPNDTGWTETNSGDRRFVIGCGPFNLNSGESVEFDYALVFTRDSIAPAVYSLNNLWQRNKQDVIKVKQWYAAANFPSCIESTDNSCYAQFTMAQDSLNNLNYYVYNGSSLGNQYSYLWNFGDGTTSTSAFPSHTYPGMGPYQLCLTVSDNSGCSSTTCDSLNAGRSSGVLTINVVPATSIENNTLLNTATFNLFPNPSSNSITIATENFENNFTIHIYDITGRLIKSEKENAGKETLIDISSIENGIYFLTATDGKQTSTKKFIKQ
jgi:hypothetical protein